MLYVCFFASRRRHTRCALVTGVQTCALPIFAEGLVGRAWIGAAAGNTRANLDVFDRSGGDAEPITQARTAAVVLAFSRVVFETIAHVAAELDLAGPGHAIDLVVDGGHGFAVFLGLLVVAKIGRAHV